MATAAMVAAAMVAAAMGAAAMAAAMAAAAMVAAMVGWARRAGWVVVLAVMAAEDSIGCRSLGSRCPRRSD